MMVLPMVSAAFRPAAFQVMLGPRHAEFLEKDSVQFVIVILTGVDQHMLSDLFQDGDYARQPDNLRSRADDGHDLDF